MASPIRPTPTMPTRSLPALALVIRTSVFLRSALGSASRSLLSLCLGLEHGGQRLGRIGEIGGIDRHAALDQPARHRDVALGIDAQNIAEMIAVQVEAQRGVGADRAAHL